MPDTEKIKKLRSLSGAGFKDCGSALEESALAGASGMTDLASLALKKTGQSERIKANG